MAEITRLTVVDEIPDPQIDEGPDLWKTGQLTKCEISRIFTCNQGRLVVPKASNTGAAPLIAKMHEAIWHMEIVYDLERLGANPIVPSWVLDSTNLVLLWHKFEPFTPIPFDDALFRHKARGHYKFVMLAAPVIADDDFMTEYAIYWLQARTTYRTSNFSKLYTEWQN